MSANKQMLAGAVVLAAALGCSFDTRSRDTASASMDSPQDVTGTYFAADSGHNLGKDWCYSGALVLDSTRHFGSVITMCGDRGEPVTERIKGTYHLRSVTSTARSGARVRRTDVVLDQEGRGKTHTLRLADGTLRFDEPWWLGAGLRALEIPDPVLRKISGRDLADSAGLTTLSSTPVIAANLPAQGSSKRKVLVKLKTAK